MLTFLQILLHLLLLAFALTEAVCILTVLGILVGLPPCCGTVGHSIVICNKLSHLFVAEGFFAR